MMLEVGAAGTEAPVSSPRLELLFGFGHLDRKWPTNPGTGLSAFLKIVVDCCSKVVVARLAGVIAGGKETTPPRTMRENLRIKHPPES
jgi:hypothetical protein